MSDPNIIIALITAIPVIITGIIGYMTKRLTVESSKSVEALIKKFDILSKSVDVLKKAKEKRDAKQMLSAALQNVIDEMIQVSSDASLTKYIIDKSALLKAFAEDYISRDISKIDIDALTRTIDVLQSSIYEVCVTAINGEFASRIKKLNIVTVVDFEDSFIKIIKDTENSKVRRLSLLMESFLQANLSKTVREYGRYKASDR